MFEKIFEFSVVLSHLSLVPILSLFFKYCYLFFCNLYSVTFF